MKRSLLLLVSLLLSTFAYSQHGIESKGFSYQGYARNASGVALGGEQIAVRVSIMPRNSSTVIFLEEHPLVNTDAFGVFHLVIGSVNTNDFEALAFGIKNYAMKVEAKTPDINYVTISNAELLAVPYAKAAGNGNPSGTVITFAGAVSKLPRGYLICDGRTLNIADYPELFEAIGTAWGGNGSTNFRLPDLRGRFLRGARLGNTSIDTDYGSRSGGESVNKIGSSQNQEIQVHSHGVNDPGHTHSYIDMHSQADKVQGGNNETARDDEFNTPRTTASSTTGVTIRSTGGSETRPVNSYVLYIIKY